MDVYRKVDAMALTELEKITINMGQVDLGQVDQLVREGFYQNRTDFIRTAIRNQLTTHAESVRQTDSPQDAGARPAALHPPRAGSGARGRRNTRGQSARLGQHRR